MVSFTIISLAVFISSIQATLVTEKLFLSASQHRPSRVAADITNASNSYNTASVEISSTLHKSSLNRSGASKYKQGQLSDFVHVRRCRETRVVHENKHRATTFAQRIPPLVTSFPHKRQRRHVSHSTSKQTYYIELGIVADKKLYENFNRDEQKLKEYLNRIVNHVDTVFRVHDVRVILTNNEIWRDSDKITITNDSGEVLEAFRSDQYSSLYMGIQLQGPKFKIVDHVHLMTGHGPFDSGVIGIAYLGTLCSPLHSVGVTVNYPSFTEAQTASILAHELGHNMNMTHDVPTCVCSDDHNTECIMSTRMPVKVPQKFSTCSVQSIAGYMKTFRKDCLVNVPNITMNNVSITCGNNRLDPGEECDCGDSAFCTNPCCNPNTCKLTEGSECFEGACCRYCKILSKGSCCRNPIDQHCDLVDYCDGVSVICPDTYKEDRTPCGNDDGHCYKGKCKSHKEQCEAIWGANITKAHNECYKLNTKGEDHGNCGIVGGTYNACAKEDIECGRLHCTEPDIIFPLQGWMRGSMTATVYYNESQYKCRMGSMILTRDMSVKVLVDEGTPCNQNGVCQNQKCVQYPTFKSNCSSCNTTNGECTQHGVCQCHLGWTGTECSEPTEIVHNDTTCLSLLPLPECVLPSTSAGQNSFQMMSLLAFSFVLVMKQIVCP